MYERYIKDLEFRLASLDDHVPSVPGRVFGSGSHAGLRIQGQSTKEFIESDYCVEV